MRYLILLLICLLSSQILGQSLDTATETYNDLILNTSKDEIYLTEGYSYYHFTSSNKYLAWYEGYTKDIYFHDIKGDSVYNLNYKSGRGPFEIGAIKDLVVIDDKLHVLDTKNYKLITYSLLNHEFIDEFSIGVNRIYKIETDGENLYGIMNSPTSLFYKIDLNSGEILGLKNSSNNELHTNIRTNAFRNDGPFLANHNYLLLIRSYEPSFIYYSKDEKIVREYIYDKVKIEPEYSKNAYGIVDRPPRELSMVLNSATILPNKPIFYYSIKGETSNIKNANPGYIYSYDLVNKIFLDPLKTQLDEISSLVINDDLIIAFDSKKFLIKKN